MIFWMQQNPGAWDIFVAYGAIICLASKSKWCLSSVVQRPDNSPSSVKKCYICSSTVKKYQGVSNLTISANLDGIPAPREFLNSKNQFSCQKTFFLDNTVPYNLLVSENILKFYKLKAKTTSKTHQLILIHTEVDIYVNFWTQFPLNNRQKLSILTVSRQNWKQLSVKGILVSARNF